MAEADIVFGERVGVLRKRVDGMAEADIVFGERVDVFQKRVDGMEPSRPRDDGSRHRLWRARGRLP